jgi:DNA-binding CsgD family transcriptional regulator
METISVILQLMLAFSGTGLWFAALLAAFRTRPGPALVVFLIYSCVSAHVLVSTVLIAAFQVGEIGALMATHEVAASAFLAAAVAMRGAAGGALLFLLGHAARRLFPARGFLASYLPAAAWCCLLAVQRLLGLPLARAETAVDILYSIALAGYCAFFLSWTPSSSPRAKAFRLPAAAALFSYLPLRIILCLYDAFAPGGITPLAFSAIDLAFFLSMNLLGYGLLAKGELTSRQFAGQGTGASGFAAACGKFSLSPRERELAALLVEGLSYKLIADRLCISVDTVKSHAKAVYRKTGSGSRAELTRLTGPHPSFTPAAAPNHP